ncbi:MAG TPA: ABC transporter ATP-binding protein [Pirellulaceae bacterium]|nr:ABC transporter ATP-binding protein [Pirellulaceae bacterium]
MNTSDERGVLLRFRGAGRSFLSGEVETIALADVDLDIPAGEMLCIVGPSGSGKTTLLNLAGGLDSPTSGEVRYREFDLGKANARQLTRYRREKVGFVFQFYNLVPNLTALENVQAVTEISPHPLDPREALERVGLSARLHHFPAQLSGGEQQRVAIARAAAKNPELMLCDEPTGALDMETGKATLRLLVDLNRDLKTTVVIITHNLALADVCERVVQMRDGRIASVTPVANRVEPESAAW